MAQWGHGTEISCTTMGYEEEKDRVWRNLSVCVFPHAFSSMAGDREHTLHLATKWHLLYAMFLFKGAP